MIEETLVVKKRFAEHPEDSFTIDRAVETGAYEGLRKAISDHQPQELIEIVKASGLRGRGGAGFSTGEKWSRMGAPKPRYVVANDDEGEPCTFKDRELSERDPHAIIEGALMAAYAVEAEAVYIYVRGEFGLGLRRLDEAIEQARAKGFIGNNIFGSGFSCEVYTHRGAGAYICGEETALLESLEGFRGQPRLKPPFFPAAKGLFHQPTALNNVETLATLPHIVLNGVDWFRSMGTEQSPGTRIFSMAGNVQLPGNYEVPMGIKFSELLELCGGIPGGKKLKAFVLGASAPWVNDPETELSYEYLFDHGSMLGSGSVIVMDEDACMVDMALNSTRFFNHESCGKCTPCREGTWWAVKVLERLERGEGRPEDADLLINICDNISADAPKYVPMGQCFCPLGDGAAWTLRGAIRMFPDEFRAHGEVGGCPRRVTPPETVAV